MDKELNTIIPRVLQTAAALEEALNRSYHYYPWKPQVRCNEKDCRTWRKTWSGFPISWPYAQGSSCSCKFYPATAADCVDAGQARALVNHGLGNDTVSWRCFPFFISLREVGVEERKLFLYLFGRKETWTGEKKKDSGSSMTCVCHS